MGDCDWSESRMKWARGWWRSLTASLFPSPKQQSSQEGGQSVKHRMLRIVQRLFQYQVLLTGEPFASRWTKAGNMGMRTSLHVCKHVWGNATAPDLQGPTDCHTLPPPSCHLGNLASVAPPVPKHRNLATFSLYFLNQLTSCKSCLPR